MNFRKETKEFIFGVLSDIFYVSLFSYLIFTVLEFLSPRFVSAFINLNALLTIVVITGIITVNNNNSKLQK